MILREQNAHVSDNVTNLDEVRKAKAANSAGVTTDSDAEKSNDRHGNRRFDAEKVARIKAAIAAGEYKIDPSRVADKFIEHDRNQ